MKRMLIHSVWAAVLVLSVASGKVQFDSPVPMPTCPPVGPCAQPPHSANLK
jgi:hypothetical protein